ncbi:hypothetical protein FUAX_55890 (plasmid) [Fulvitalea axinellae]|uniref:Uncharacterized protein n=1 Tax=Fulvitalea axinellae TaxID=1182444 RepID=A0AAU9D206_9BACT|nr:hypothetical protein FUAX_55890 [Fulvitalea axinellae]
MEQSEAQKWAEETIRLFVEEIRKRKIRDTGELEASFKAVITMRGVDLHSAKISYAIQGLFTKLGVGKGQRFDEKKDNAVLNSLAGRKTRKGKNWSSKVWKEQITNLLQQLYHENLNRAKSEIDGSVSPRFEMNF